MKQRSISYKITPTYSLRVVQPIGYGMWSVTHNCVSPVSWQGTDDAQTHREWKRFSRGREKVFAEREGARALARAFQRHHKRLVKRAVQAAKEIAQVLHRAHADVSGSAATPPAEGGHGG